MDWTIEQMSRSVHRLTFDNVKAGWEGWVMLRSDAHHDSPDNVEWLERDHLELAKERGAAIIDNGDLFDAMGGRYDKRRTEANTKGRHKVDNYFDSILDEASEFYHPYAENFALLGMGNHETAVLKHHNLNITSLLCRDLKRAGGNTQMGRYGGYVLFTFNIGGSTETLRLKYFHGAGGGGPVTKGVIQSNRHAVKWPDADIVVTGHIHEAWDVDIVQERLNNAGTLTKRKQTHLCTPGYKSDYGDGADGWEVERDGQPKPLGCYWLHFRYRDRRGRGVPGMIKTTAIKDTEAW